MAQTDIVSGPVISLWTRVVPFFVGLALYGRLKRKFAVVVPQGTSDAIVNAPTVHKDETAALLKKPEVAHSGGVGTATNPRQSYLNPLILWAVVMLPICAVAWYMIVFGLTDGRAVVYDPTNGGVTVIWHSVYFAGIAAMPAAAALQIVLYGAFSDWLMKPQDRAENLHILIRCAILDGVIIPPLIAIWIVSMYPERLFSGSDWRWVGLLAHTSQAIVWTYFFVRSKRESEKMAGIRPVL